MVRSLKNSVIVTGSHGYVGSATVELLEMSGYKVVGIDKKINKDTRNIILFFAECFKKPKSIIHLSSKKSIPESIKKPYAYYFNNILSTLSVGMASRVFNIPVVFASSAAVYTPYNPYARSKLIEETILKILCKRVVILRYFNLVGKTEKSQDKNGTNIFSIINNDPRININNSKSTRDYVNIKDVANANLLALEYAQNNKFLITDIFTGEQKTMLDVVQEYKNNGVEIIYDVLDLPDVTVLPKIDHRSDINWNPKISFSDSVASEVKYN